MFEGRINQVNTSKVFKIITGNVKHNISITCFKIIINIIAFFIYYYYLMQVLQD